MLPRPGSIQGDSRRLEGTTARLERDDRQRVIARSPLPSLTWRIALFGFESLPHRHIYYVSCLFLNNLTYNA